MLHTMDSRERVRGRLADQPGGRTTMSDTRDEASPGLPARAADIGAGDPEASAGAIPNLIAGLVETEKDGRVRRVTLVPGAFTPVRSWLDDQRALWEGRLDRLDDYVTRLMKERADGSRSQD